MSFCTHIFYSVHYENISAEQFGQDPDLINCVINRKIKAAGDFIRENESRTIFSRDDKKELNV